MYIKRLKDLREDKDMTQEQISKIINCKQQSYSYYENGKRIIPYETMIELSKFYKTSVDYILGLTNVKEPYPRKKED